MVLEELIERYFEHFDQIERHYRLKYVCNIILSAIADFNCLEIINSQSEITKVLSNNCKRNLISFLLKLFRKFASELEPPLLEAIKDVSISLNVSIIITATPDDRRSKEYWHKAAEYEESIRQKAAKSLASLLKEYLTKAFDMPTFFDEIDRILSTKVWMGRS